MREWVRRTTRHLQLALIDQIVDAIRSNQLYRIIDKSKLREAAFNSHPKAYLDGGLMAVATYEPACLPIVAMIPYEQFNPSNPNFIPTFRQVIAVVQQGGILEWYNAITMAGPRVPFSVVKVAVEEALIHAPGVNLPNPRAMVEQLVARELAALRDRCSPCGGSTIERNQRTDRPADPVQ